MKLPERVFSVLGMTQRFGVEIPNLVQIHIEQRKMLLNKLVYLIEKGISHLEGIFNSNNNKPESIREEETPKIC